MGNRDTGLSIQGGTTTSRAGTMLSKGGGSGSSVSSVMLRNTARSMTAIGQKTDPGRRTLSTLPELEGADEEGLGERALIERKKRHLQALKAFCRRYRNLLNVMRGCL